jgi:hypothetical protein
VNIRYDVSGLRSGENSNRNCCVRTEHWQIWQLQQVTGNAGWLYMRALMAVAGLTRERRV